MAQPTGSKRIFGMEQRILLVAALLLCVLEYYFHKSIVFCQDDIWYSTNIVTGESLKSFADIWESQVWHFYNWGGRNITHALLQAVLMTGNTAADFINVGVTILLAFIMNRLAGTKGLFWLIVANLTIFFFNDVPYMNIAWEAGSVNYLYSTCWIFFFVFAYLRELQEEKPAALKGAVIWMLPLGLITGWSNENMGPAAICIAGLTVLYLWIRKKQRPTVWMIEGIVTGIVGCAFMLLAPGNYVRSSLLEGTLLRKLLRNAKNLYAATFDYLFTAFLIVLLLLMVNCLICKNKLTLWQTGIGIFAILANGAMFLSPTYPSRATFGVLAILGCLAMTLLNSILQSIPKLKVWIYSLAGLMYVGTVIYIVASIKYNPFY